MAISELKPLMYMDINTVLATGIIGAGNLEASAPLRAVPENHTGMVLKTMLN